MMKGHQEGFHEARIPGHRRKPPLRQARQRCLILSDADPTSTCSLRHFHVSRGYQDSCERFPPEQLYTVVDLQKTNTRRTRSTCSERRLGQPLQHILGIIGQLSC
jgi:hypothetical protein